MEVGDNNSIQQNAVGKKIKAAENKFDSQSYENGSRLAPPNDDKSVLSKNVKEDETKQCSFKAVPTITSVFCGLPSKLATSLNFRELIFSVDRGTGVLAIEEFSALVRFSGQSTFHKSFEAPDWVHYCMAVEYDEPSESKHEIIRLTFNTGAAKAFESECDKVGIKCKEPKGNSVAIARLQNIANGGKKANRAAYNRDALKMPKVVQLPHPNPLDKEKANVNIAEKRSTLLKEFELNLKETPKKKDSHNDKALSRGQALRSQNGTKNKKKSEKCGLQRDYVKMFGNGKHMMSSKDNQNQKSSIVDKDDSGNKFRSALGGSNDNSNNNGNILDGPRQRNYGPSLAKPYENSDTAVVTSNKSKQKQKQKNKRIMSIRESRDRSKPY